MRSPARARRGFVCAALAPFTALAATSACESSLRRATRTEPSNGAAASPASKRAATEATEIHPRSLPIPPPAEHHARWNAYWHTGQAELSRFALRQARYGSVHEGGDAVFVFVTEDFLSDRQVKSEKPRPPEQVVPVLKWNLMRRFVTGIYDYSMMTSVFSPTRPRDPADRLAALKVTTSVQEWCGHVYAQLNRTRGASGTRGYQLRAHSYFEDEGDEARTLPDALLEDALWNQLRIAPWAVPVGDDVPVIPSTQWSRLAHVPSAPSPAQLRLWRVDAETLRYTIVYPALGRTLAIELRAAFPYDVLRFEETYPDGFGPTRGPRTTTAHRTHLVRDAYWQHNRPHDRSRRGALGLPNR